MREERWLYVVFDRNQEHLLKHPPHPPIVLLWNQNNPLISAQTNGSSLPAAGSLVVEVVPTGNGCQKSRHAHILAQEGPPGGEARAAGWTNPTNQQGRGRVYRRHLPLAWLPTKTWTAFHARDQALQSHSVALCLSYSPLNYGSGHSWGGGAGERGWRIRGDGVRPEERGLGRPVCVRSWSRPEQSSALGSPTGKEINWLDGREWRFHPLSGLVSPASLFPKSFF